MSCYGLFAGSVGDSESSTTRNPMVGSRRPVVYVTSRHAARHSLGLLTHEPPSRTAPPCSAVAGGAARHHSQTLPCMSYRPQRLGAKVPTAVGLRRYSPPPLSRLPS